MKQPYFVFFFAFSPILIYDEDIDLGSYVTMKYHHQSPFAFNGKINSVKVDLL